jgi:hypothetical protein
MPAFKIKSSKNFCCTKNNKSSTEGDFKDSKHTEERSKKGEKMKKKLCVRMTEKMEVNLN